MNTPEQSRKNQAAWRKRNPVKAAETSRAQQIRRLDYLRRLKTETPCADCGLHFPYYMMEFDHVKAPPKKGNGKKKRVSINAMSFADMLVELDKCDIVCANCHSARTHFRRTT